MATDAISSGEVRRWKAAGAGALVAAGLAVTSAAGWWDGDAAETAEARPDVETGAVTSAAAGPVRATPPVAIGEDEWAPRTAGAVGGDDGHVNPWAAGNEAVRRLLVASASGAPGTP